MARRVIMIDSSLGVAPRAIRDEARVRFQEIAEGLEDIPAESAFWASVSVSDLRLAVHGWSFSYTVDDNAVRVTGVHAG